MYSDYPTLLSFDAREVPAIPHDIIGKESTKTTYTRTAPREWTDGEIEWLKSMKEDGYTNAEIAESMGRSETSISIKLKRIGKTNNGYNDSHREEKYKANWEFFELIKPSIILDAYCGTESFWSKTNAKVVSNDIDPDIDADRHLPADRLIAEYYSKGYHFDLIDLDPCGSAYDCFDQSIKMAKKGIIITLGEMGHKRWKRLDFVRRYYGIEKLSDFTTERLIEEIRRIGRRNKKELTPVIVKEWARISRVYFTIEQMKITEQWEKR